MKDRSHYLQLSITREDISLYIPVTKREGQREELRETKIQKETEAQGKCCRFRL